MDKIMTLNYDIVIVGGGTAGVSCAWSIEENLNVLVIEKLLSLGGTQTNGLVTPMMPTWTNNHTFHKELNLKLENKIATKLIDQEHPKTTWFNPEMMELTMQEMLNEKNVDVLYNSQVVDVKLHNNKICALKVMSFNHFIWIEAKNFVDASADAWLARLCQIPTFKAPENEHSSLTQRFEMGNINLNKFKNWCSKQEYKFYNPNRNDDFFEFVYVPNSTLLGNISSIFEQGVLNKELKRCDIIYIQAFTMPGKKNTLSFNNPQLPHKLVPTNPVDLSRGVILAQQAQERLCKFFKHQIPGFEEACLIKRASLMGIRESYRIQGIYIMDENDYLNEQKFSDGIAQGDWYVDVHSDNEVEKITKKYELGHYYEIPYRSLICQEIDNYIAVGRHISTSFLMQASTRIQTTCQDTGSAAGLACSYSIKNNIPLNQIEGKIIKKLLTQ